jgi:RNA polymerase sigma-70 factor (ECF subfamily)
MMAAATFETGSVAESDLIVCVRHLRAFAWFLTKNRERADDLVQDATVRALTAAHGFQPGINLKAWMFAILRHLHYNEVRKNCIRIQSLDDSLSYEPAVLSGQVVGLEFGGFRRSFWKLGDDWREALILGASGLSYEEVAKVCDCSRRTVKSRVSRARSELLRILEDDLLAGKRRNTPALAGYVGHLLDSKRAASPAASAQYERPLSPAYHAASFGS